MITIKVPARNFWDEANQQFIETKAQTLTLEHSLVSISKWEQKWHVPFLDKKDMTQEQVLDYIRCMTITPNVDPLVYHALTDKNLLDIKEYIDDPATATWINDKKKNSRPHRPVTSELIYYWMFKLQIDKSCEKWPLNRLLILIEVFEEEEKAATKKTTMNQRYARHNALNKARRAKKH